MRLLGLRVPFTNKRSGFAVTDDRAFSPFPWFFAKEGETVVTPETSLRFSAVFACVKIISETVASVPLLLYERRKDGGKERAVNHPLYTVLRTRPNSLKTSGFEFRQMLMSHVLLWGNGYAQILRNKMGEPLELHVLHPSRVTPKVLEVNNSYKVIYELQTSKEGKIIIEGADMLHLRGYRDSGLEGLSPIAAAREAIRAGLSLESFGTNFFEGGAFPAGVLEYDGGEMPEEARDNLKKSWQQLYGGANRGKKVAILEAGLKWKPMGIPQGDAQFLEQRRFQIEEIARIFRVPPHMLADLTRSTYSNIENQGQEFITYCLLPWFRMWEDAITRDFFEGDDRKFYAEFLVDALLRGDTTARTAAYTAGKVGGWLNTNEIRLRENLNPIGPEGDVYLTPANMTESGKDPEDGKEDDDIEDPLPAKKSDEAKARAAFKPPLVGTWTRIIRKHVSAIKTAAKKKNEEEFRAWLIEFVEEQRTFATECLSDLHAGYSMIAQDAPSLQSCVADYCEEVMRSAMKWLEDPSRGLDADEGKSSVFWGDRMMGYTEGSYDTNAA